MKTIVAITGTNGKTTTTRLLSYILLKAGRKVGFTCTDGIYINGIQQRKGDCSGPISAGELLENNDVEHAVLECARGGMLREGLAFKQCDIGIVTNIGQDHIGQKGINTIEDLANIKAMVPRSVRKEGYAILNMDDPYVEKMKDGLTCNIGWFTWTKSAIDKNSELYAYVDKTSLVFRYKQKELIIKDLHDIPLTIHGKAVFMVSNILPAVMGAMVLGVEEKSIDQALRSFTPGPENTPGRINIFNYTDDRKIIMDYVHNPHGYEAIEEFLDKWDNYKVGIITAVGDRRPQDIIQNGVIAGRAFDEIIIRMEQDTRGGKPEELQNLLLKGIHSIDPTKKVHLINDQNEAIRQSLEICPKGGIVFLTAEHVEQTIEFISSISKN